MAYSKDSTNMSKVIINHPLILFLSLLPHHLNFSGTPAEHKSLFDTIVDLAKDRTQVIPFNLASEALNNSFFLNGLVSLNPPISF